MTAPHEQFARLLDLDASGRPLNPDTNLPYPASAAQEQLSENVLARLLDALPHLSHAEGEVIRGALVEVAVRQHGRTLRDIRGELRAAADGYEQAARDTVEAALSGPSVDGKLLADASRTAAHASALRAVVLGGWRS